MLTKDDLQVLQAPFRAEEHEFLKGNAYITEGAITSRIEQVDPAWKLEQINLFNRADSKQVICTVRLTINDTWRDGVGMSVITMTKQGDNEANEAEKSAATDAFKRAARLFGVGRYLLDLPGKVVDVQSMREWLGQSVGNTTQKPQPAAQKPAPQPPQAQSTTEPLELVDNGVYRVNSFTMNMSKGRVQKPYMVFAIGKSAAFSYTREPFRLAGYNVDDWTKVTNYELPTAADITVEKDNNGYFIVKSVKMIDLFADSKTA